MALVIAKYVNGRPVDGLDTWWDEIERALEKTSQPFPLMRSIDAYQLRTLSSDEVLDLRIECEQFLPLIDGAAFKTISRLYKLTTSVLSNPDSKLRLIGD